MKIKLLRIVIIVLLFAVSAETLSYLWMQPQSSVMLAEKEQKEKEDNQKEKKGSEDKLVSYHILSLLQYLQKSYPVKPTDLTNSLYFPLPELPPESV